jgi:hypothetical protein
MDPERLQWNQDGAEAVRRLNNQGLRTYTSDQYREAFREVRREREEKKARALDSYSGPAKNGWRIYAQGDQVVEAEFVGGDGRSLTNLANVVLGLPRLADGQVDLALAVEVISANFPGLAMRAAGDFLNAAAMRMMRDQNAGSADVAATDPYRSLLGKMLARARGQYPEVAAVYDGGAVTEDALRTMLWPLLKGPPTAQRFERRNYESIRSYSFER